MSKTTLTLTTNICSLTKIATLLEGIFTAEDMKDPSHTNLP